MTRRAFVSIEGPPGAGKTTLIEQEEESREIYRGDDTPSTQVPIQEYPVSESSADKARARPGER